MSAPVPQGPAPAGPPPQGPLPPPKTKVSQDEVVAELSNAASQVAQKGAMATDGTQAKDFGAAALSYVQAIIALQTPRPSQNPPQAPPGPQKPAQSPTAA